MVSRKSIVIALIIIGILISVIGAYISFVIAEEKFPVTVKYINMEAKYFKVPLPETSARFTVPNSKIILLPLQIYDYLDNELKTYLRINKSSAKANITFSVNTDNILEIRIYKGSWESPPQSIDSSAYGYKNYTLLFDVNEIYYLSFGNKGRSDASVEVSISISYLYPYLKEKTEIKVELNKSLWLFGLMLIATGVIVIIGAGFIKY
jgi:hypothetical protein